MGLMKKTGTSLLVLLLLAVLSACDTRKECEDAVCPIDQDLVLSLVDTVNTNLISSGLITQKDVLFLSPAKGDTLSNKVNISDGTVNSPMIRDQGHYTIVIGQQANIDLLVYQAYVPSKFDCCPGYWRIDSVFARGQKLEMDPSSNHFYLKIN